MTICTAFLESGIKLGLTQEQIACKCMAVQAAVANAICLLVLPEEAKGLVSRGTI